MLDTLLLAIYAGLFISGCTALGAAVVFFMFKGKAGIYTQLSLGFSAGIMLAASIFSLLMPAIELGDEASFSRLVPVVGGFILGMIFLICIDKCTPHLHLMANSPEGPKSHLGRHSLMFLAITIHNIPEGMAVGVSVAAASTGNGLLSAAAILALGIGIQNIPEGAAVSMPYYSDGFSKVKSFALGSLSGIVELIAAVSVALIAESVIPYLPWVLSFAAGTMMYVVIEELIPQSHEFDNSDKGTLSVLAGFLLMMCLDVSLG
ncbi:MAG: ZIP family metal transporter [Succinivibrio sp.]